MPLSYMAEIYNLLEQMQLDYQNGNIGKQNANIAFLNVITDGGTDSVTLDDYAGKKIIALAGIVTATKAVEVVSSAPGYALTPATPTDNIFLNGSGIGLINVLGFFNVTASITGVGTEVSWNTGRYSSVFVVYADESNTSPTSNTGMIRFTTVDAVDTYTDSALTNITVGVVVYGQSILAPSQYTKTVGSDTITIDPGLPVEGGLQLIIIPA
jgi:hypothetical protein